MKLNRKNLMAASMLPAMFTGALLFSGSAAALPVGWTCAGNCGSMGPDGVVTASSQGGNYFYVSTSGGTTNISHLELGSETNGSVATSNMFTASAGDDLQFSFNYVTSDGASFSDYAWVRLLDSALNPILFTARTTPDGNTVPGFGMPDLVSDVTLDPESTPIIPGGPEWSALGGYSGSCFNIAGCGYTDWIEMTYQFEADGTYALEFGVVNWTDTLYDSGLAFDGILVGGVPIDDPQPVSAPGTLALFGLSLLGMAGLRRRRLV